MAVEFVRKNPIATDCALYAEFNRDDLRAVVVDKTGALVWSDRQTPQDAAWKRLQADNPMTMSMLLCERVSPLFSLNEQTRKAAKPGKMTALMYERGGMPPANEREPMPGRVQAMKKALPNATLIVFSPRVRAADKAAETGDAADLAKLISDAGLCKARAAQRTLLLKASQSPWGTPFVSWCRCEGKAENREQAGWRVPHALLRACHPCPARRGGR